MIFVQDLIDLGSVILLSRARVSMRLECSWVKWKSGDGVQTQLQGGFEGQPLCICLLAKQESLIAIDSST